MPAVANQSIHTERKRDDKGVKNRSSISTPRHNNTTLNVGETMSSDDALRGNTADGDHGKSSIEQFRIDLGLVLFRITGLELMPAKVCLFRNI
jgi:hypothetical protein